MTGMFDGHSYFLRPIDQPERKMTSENLFHSSYGLFSGSKLMAEFLVGDELRPEAVQLVKWAVQEHLEMHLLSGDRQYVVESCANLLGFKKGTYQAEASPELKASTIQNCKKETAMIGDGANDAAALASSSVGIAICGSLDVSLRAADVYLTRPNLSAIIELFEISRLTRSAIYRNLFLSASFNTISGILAASGLMTPLWAAVLMPISSVTILMSSVWTGNKFNRKKNT